jgi:hypothetical protein
MTLQVVTIAALVSRSSPPRSAPALAADATHERPIRISMAGSSSNTRRPMSSEASGARDACEPWITIGVGDARGLRARFTLEIRGMENRWGLSSGIPCPSGR